MEFRQIELYIYFFYGMSSDYIVVLWNVVRLYCLFNGMSSDYIVCFMECPQIISFALKTKTWIVVGSREATALEFHLRGKRIRK